MDKDVGLDVIDELVDSRFRFVLLAAHRAQQLMAGARPRFDAPKQMEPPRIAMTEVLNGMVEWDYGPAPESVEEPAAEAPAPASEETEPGVN